MRKPTLRKSWFFHACAPGVALGPPQDFTRIGCSVIFRKSWVVGTGAKTDIAKIAVFPCMCSWGRPRPPPRISPGLAAVRFSKALGGRHRGETRHCEDRVLFPCMCRWVLMSRHPQDKLAQNHSPWRLLKTVWPSGLRRWLKAPVRKGVGSNPTAVIFCMHRSCMYDGAPSPQGSENEDGAKVIVVTALRQAPVFDLA